MKKSTTLPIAALAAPALWAFALPADRLAFGVSEGTTVDKTFVSESDMALEDMSIVMNGEEVDQSMMGGGFDMSMSNVQTVRVTDRYVAIADGRPEKLRRTYEELESVIEMEASGPMVPDGGEAMEALSELEGVTVEFVWDAEKGAYVPAFAEDSDGEAELLENLFEDMDLRELLPDGEVSEGDTWEISADALKNLLAPGGDLKLLPEEVEMQMQMPSGGNPFDMLGDFEGTFTGEYAGQREVDGTKVGVVKLTIDAATTKDMTELVNEAMADIELPAEVGDMEYDSVDVEFEFSGAGELLWNLERGHFHELDISGDVLMAMDMAYSMSAQGMDMSMEMSMEMSGTQNMRASTGAAQ